MQFNSFDFLIWFFPIVTVVFFLLRQRLRWAWLLLASCYFYMAFVPLYILVLAFVIAVDYSAGILIERNVGARRRICLIASLAVNIGVLALFKYVDFAGDTAQTLAGLMNWRFPIRHLGWILPIGLSFHTFQSMTYTIEVFRGRQAAERHFGIFALYVMFYPQLVAGPIERPQNLLPQFRREHFFDYERIVSGLQLMTWGLFQKVVVADSLGPFVDSVYAHPSEQSALGLALGTYAFAFQILCDFSGYSDIAIGAAEVMGFKLMRNFAQPYLSSSVPEFWRRWHISLSTWFRDYVYLPLGGNRVALPRFCWNVMLVFVLSGLWHGPSWKFAIWGALNGVYVIASRLTSRWRGMAARFCRLESHASLRRAAGIVLTFHLICFSWIFFRANSLGDAFLIAGRILHVSGHGWTARFPFRCVIFIGLLIGIHWLQRRMRLRETLRRQPIAIRWLVYYAGVLATLLGAQWFVPRQFVYFQF